MNIFVIAESPEPGLCTIHGIFSSLQKAVTAAPGINCSKGDTHIEEIPFDQPLPNNNYNGSFTALNDVVAKYDLKGVLLSTYASITQGLGLD